MLFCVLFAGARPQRRGPQTFARRSGDYYGYYGGVIMGGMDYYACRQLP